jgi:broad specificity phosphatase PhoE
MTTVYFITNNYVLHHPCIYQKEISEEQKKVDNLLSFKGEKTASELLKKEELKKVKTLYSSNYKSAIGTAKYLSEELDLPIYVDERLKERQVGILGANDEFFLKEMQEHDFDYKFHNGESFNMVIKRMKTCLKDILFHNEDEVVAVFTHDIALESLLTIWCEKGYSLENQMILNYKDKVIIDGAYHQTRIFRLDFEGDKLRNITWEQEKEL